MLMRLQLRNGQLVSIPPYLIRRLKSHFYHIPPPCGPTGVDIILGLNGYVWVSLGTTQEKRDGGEGFDAEGVYSDKNDVSLPKKSGPLGNEVDEAGYHARGKDSDRFGCWDH